MPNMARATSRAACAHQTGQGDHLAGADLEGDVQEHALAREAVDVENDVAGLMGLCAVLCDVAPDHRADEVAGREALERLGEDELAVAQHGDPLADARRPPPGDGR